MAIALCFAIAFAGFNQDIITQVKNPINLTAYDLEMEKAQLVADFNKERYEKLKNLHGEENKETKKAELDWKISVLDLKILKLKR